MPEMYSDVQNILMAEPRFANCNEFFLKTLDNNHKISRMRPKIDEKINI